MNHVEYIRERNDRKGSLRPRLLVLASRFPYPVLGGDRLRVYNFLKILSRRYDVDFLSLHPVVPPSEAVAHLGSFLKEVHCFQMSAMRSITTGAYGAITRRWPLQVGYYYSRQAASWVRSNAGRYDAIFCFHVRMTEYASDVPLRKIVDLVDAISMNYTIALRSTPDPHWRLIYRFEIPRLLSYERSVVAAFDRAILISAVDRNFLAAHGADAAKMTIVPNGTDLLDAGSESAGEEDIDLLFHGNMGTQANRAAAMFLLRDVLPLLRRGGKRFNAYIVGTHPSGKLRSLSDGKQVVVTGEVADVSPYIRRAKVVVAPMVFGAGVQNKILEAMAFGKPVVTTSLGAEGIEGMAGCQYFVADTPEEFAAATVRLLEDRSLRASVGEAGRALIRERYTWEASEKKLLNEMEVLLSSPSFRRQDTQARGSISL